MIRAIPPSMHTIIHSFALIFVPLACWQKWIFPSIPNYYLQHALVYFVLLFLAWAGYKRIICYNTLWRWLRYALPVLCVLLATQAYACYNSATFFIADGQSPWLAMLFSLIKFLVQLPFVAVFLLLTALFIATKNSYRFLFYGAVFAFSVIVLICFLQEIFLITCLVPWEWAQTLHYDLGRFLEECTFWLEAQWPGEQPYDFYNAKIYVTHSLRMNGIFEESSALGTVMGVFFLPLGLGLLSLQGGWQRKGWILSVLSLLVMFVSASFTGIALGFIGLVLFCVVCATKTSISTKNIIFISGAVVFLALLCAGLLEKDKGSVSSPPLSKRLQAYYNTPSPRIINTLGLCEIVTQNPIAGVGRGWTTPYLLQQKRYGQASVDNSEMQFWAQQKSVPILSALPGMAAEYGVIFVFAGFAIVAWLWLQLRHFMKEDTLSEGRRFAFVGFSCWVVLSFVALWAILDIRNPLFNLPFFFASAFVWQMRTFQKA